MCVCICLYVCLFVCYMCVCVCIHIHRYAEIHHGSLFSSSGRDQYEKSCITHHIGQLWWKLWQPNKHHIFTPCEYFPFTYMQPLSYSFLVQTVCACYVHSLLVACVGIYARLRFTSFICGEWDLGMQATVYKCNFSSHWVYLYTEAYSLTAAHLIWRLITSVVGILALHDQPRTFLWAMQWTPEVLVMWGCD